MSVLKIGAEVLTVFCVDCKCCLARSGHCAKCHTAKAIKTLCGCGDCQAKAKDYLERESIRQRRVAAARAIRNLNV
jgi:hypothetical protein